MKQTRIDIFLAIILAAFVALVVVIADRRHPAPVAAAEIGDNAIRFATLEVYVDPHKSPFAGYQLEIIPTPAAGREVFFTGLSDGETHPAFSGEAAIPYYDAKALNLKSSHLIIAGLSTDAALPDQKTRVAQVHVSYTGSTPPTFTFVNSLVASSDARKMESATVSLDLVLTAPKPGAAQPPAKN
jgi:hypothetical protein